MRTVRESLRFTEQCSKLGVDVRRLDEVLDGIKVGLGLDAESFADAPDTRLGVLLTDAFDDIPQFQVFFTIVDDDYVDLDWIEEDREDPADPT